MRTDNKQLKEWTGDFGYEYTKRNLLSIASMEKLYKFNYGIGRLEMNKIFLDKLNRSARILEVGSNIGNQLLYLRKMGFKNLYAVEPQGEAVEFAKKRVKCINIVKGDIFDIPFKDRYFDLVFTSGVLIHISPKDIRKALKEIYRCSRRYIWGFEYYSNEYTSIIYRGKPNLLWKADFVQAYLSTLPGLKIIKRKFFKYLENDNFDIMYLLERKNVKY